MANKLAQDFQKADTNNAGSVSKSQFNSIFSIMRMPARLKSEGADAVYQKLDPKGTGKVSKQDFVNGMMKEMDKLRAQGRAGENPPPPPDGQNGAPPPPPPFGQMGGAGQNNAYASGNPPPPIPPDKLAYSPESLKAAQTKQAGQYTTMATGTRFNAYA